ncbi:hypothetical protein Desor_1081 [Desulfosporosinus orientis DSM 765]|uniref:Uncharacterized protein n=1 Tax=Desulfosporosinus orientis (strain ATCC 19365 / DSM 765 / NCIMB 8382 / VKM B-1628 / Singapore I) TaxID=768706 RepID=G7WAI7_DESOD|nr:hypothetical protein Desor_1081 [Desulfosporosinus orientis DSM 765]
MNNGYNRFSTIQRNPCLFRQNSTRSTSTYYSARQPYAPRINDYFLTSFGNPRQTSNCIPSPLLPLPPLPYLPNSPYTAQLPFPHSPSFPLQFSSLPAAAYSYAPTVSSKGLTIVLIATLIMVALDLVIVRPQKGRITH